MSGYLDWQPMNDIIHARADKVVLRVTEGDSEWIDCTSKKYKLIAKKEPWEDFTDFSGPLFIIDGVFPHEATWLGEKNEPGRIVFNLSEKHTDLNTKKQSYFCRIIETDQDGKNARSVFMGKFKVVPAGDNYVPMKEDYERNTR